MERLKVSIWFLVVISVFLSCATHHEITEEENFHKFHKKFYRDSIFQYSRINFPLTLDAYNNQKVDPKGNKKAGHSHKEFNRKELPRTIKGVGQLPRFYSMKIDTVGNKIIERLFIPRGSYVEKRFFIMQNNQWYLDSIQIVD